MQEITYPNPESSPMCLLLKLEESSLLPEETRGVDRELQIASEINAACAVALRTQKQIINAETISMPDIGGNGFLIFVRYPAGCWQGQLETKDVVPGKILLDLLPED